jgi:hypothetical protein
VIDDQLRLAQAPLRLGRSRAARLVAVVREALASWTRSSTISAPRRTCTTSAMRFR